MEAVPADHSHAPAEFRNGAREDRYVSEVDHLATLEDRPAIKQSHATTRDDRFASTDGHPVTTDYLTAADHNQSPAKKDRLAATKDRLAATEDRLDTTEDYPDSTRNQFATTADADSSEAPKVSFGVFETYIFQHDLHQNRETKLSELS